MLLGVDIILFLFIYRQKEYKDIAQYYSIICQVKIP
jgi:hypothetical protein